MIATKASWANSRSGINKTTRARDGHRGHGLSEVLSAYSSHCNQVNRGLGLYLLTLCLHIAYEGEVDRALAELSQAL